MVLSKAAGLIGMMNGVTIIGGKVFLEGRKIFSKNRRQEVIKESRGLQLKDLILYAGLKGKKSDLSSYSGSLLLVSPERKEDKRGGYNLTSRWSEKTENGAQVSQRVSPLSSMKISFLTPYC